MASHSLPGLALTAFWGTGFNGWGDQMDQDMLKLSSLGMAKVLDRVAAVPGSPANGDMYILTAAPNNKAIAVRDNNVWVYYQPLEGWMVWVADEDVTYYYTGSAWAIFTAPISTSGTLTENSDSRVATQKATKTYADAVLATALAADANMVKDNATSTFTAGQKATATDLGTKSSGTLTPTIDASNGNLQRVINGGAFALAAPSTGGDYTIILEIKNNGSAGAISFSGWTKNPDGDAFTTVNNAVFAVTIFKLNAHTWATIKQIV